LTDLVPGLPGFCWVENRVSDKCFVALVFAAAVPRCLHRISADAATALCVSRGRRRNSSCCWWERE